MKALLVTSEVTYVPHNYFELFEEVMGRASQHVAGLVILRNFNFKLVRDALGLRILGARQISKHLLRNALELRLRERERLFTSRGLPVLETETMNSPEMISWVRDKRIDVIINVRTRCIYRKEILGAPRLGCINIHHGLLPEYRGTLCDLYALREGRPAGFTIHRMNEKIDAGEILVRKTVSRPGGERDYPAYLARTGKEEGIALAELLEKIARTGSFPPGIPNSCSAPVYTRNPDRGLIRKMRREGMSL